nr:GH92 family glycosyl hydrolase [uncultured Carboxylicivirga sp.]
MNILKKKLKPLIKIIPIALLILLVSTTNAQEKKDYTHYVDPFIGTGGHGHTFPGATLPFGMVQLSPDTGIEGWDWCSGYHESDSSVIGFSHTHLSGTGGADYGDVLLMPTVGNVNFQPGTKADPDASYRSRFSHDNEIASPGYYSILLDDYNIKAELTATLRTGMHKYTFPESDEAHIILDLEHGIANNVTNADIHVLSDTKVEGTRFSQGWASDQRLFFAMEFSKPFDKVLIVQEDKLVKSTTKAEGKSIKAAFNYHTKEGEAIIVKVAISSVSCENAWANMEAENKGFDFDATLAQAKETWNKELAKIEVEGGSDDEKVIFYTALYHTKIHPNTFQDVNGEYRGMDMKIHKAEGRSHYTLYSLWDTFRGLHPLYSIVDTKYNNDFIKSMIAKYNESGRLPVWELWSNETNTMIGYHSVPVIADAILKGYYTGDVQEAYQAMLSSAMADGQGLKDYKHMHYIPREKEANSVSKTVEYAFDDYCIALVALKLGKIDDYKEFTLRSLNYRNVFDPETKFMRGRDENGVWNPDFDPMAITLFGSGDFTEGNSWHYSFFAPHDINGLIELYGGKDAFIAKLDEMFEQDAVNDNEHAHDVTGLIGQYAQGNEPSHHVIYTYNFAQRPDKTQAMIRRVMKEMYTTDKDGYSGNEDTGQMSAWYVLSSMGFYSMNPVSGEYIIGSPVFDKVTINLENSKQFIIEANNNSDDNVYISSATLNGKAYDYTYIKHTDIMQGGKLTFEMSSTPQSWGTSIEAAPIELAANEDIEIEPRANKAFMPYPASSAQIFKNHLPVELLCQTEGVTIYYTLDGTSPTTKSKVYSNLIILKKSTTLKAISVKEGYITSDVKSIQFRKAYFNDGKSEYPVLSTEATISQAYNPGKQTLIDGKLGSNNYRDGLWTGTNDKKFNAVIDLGTKKKISQVTINFTQNTGSWIFPPKSITILGSNDGENFTEIANEQYELPSHHVDILVLTKTIASKTKARYLKVIIESAGKLPSWHSGSGLPSYLFIDEITVE